jgi:hypothetical protein
MTRPQSTEAADYYFKYIDLVPSEDIVPVFKDQLDQTVQLLEGISEEQSLHSYAPGKWTIREVLNHVNDGERVFLGRAFWFARGFQDPLPSFEQDVAVQYAHANETSWAELVEEFKNVRASTISFLRTCRTRPGRGRESQVTTQSQSGLWRTSWPDTSSITRTCCARSI